MTVVLCKGKQGTCPDPAVTEIAPSGLGPIPDAAWTPLCPRHINVLAQFPGSTITFRAINPERDDNDSNAGTVSTAT